MRIALALAFLFAFGACAEASPLLALAKPLRERRVTRVKTKEEPKPTPKAEPAALPPLPSEDPYNLFHMMSQPLPEPKPAAQPLRRPVLPRPPGPVPPLHAK